MFMPFVANDYAALALMGLALFGNQWVAATYIGPSATSSRRRWSGA